MVHILQDILDFELIQTYLNWGYLNAIYIYILDAPKLLEIVMGHWNNSESTHNYFQDFIKWFDIKTNQKQIAEIEKKTEQK